MDTRRAPQNHLDQVRILDMSSDGKVSPVELGITIPLCSLNHSDIVAELAELQPSAITEHQTDISYPSGIYESFNEGTQLPEPMQSKQSNNMFIYSSQIHLRVLLNDAQNSLYGRIIYHIVSFLANSLPAPG